MKHPRIAALAVAPVALVALAGCGGHIPQSSIDLTDHMYQIQTEHVGDVGEMVAIYGEMIDFETERQLQPLTDLETRLRKDLDRLAAWQTMLADTNLAIPESWEKDSATVQLHATVSSFKDDENAWAPWIAHVDKYGIVVEDDATFSDANLERDGSLQRTLVTVLLQDQLDGQPHPVPEVDVLRTEWNKFEQGFSDHKKVQAQTKAFLVIFEKYRPQPLSIRLVQLQVGVANQRADGQALLHDLATERATAEQTARAVSQKMKQRMDAVHHNAEEVERGLEVLATGLRTGRSTIFQPKDLITGGLGSLTQNLEQLGLIDHQKAASLQSRYDEFSAKYDAFVNEQAP